MNRYYYDLHVHSCLSPCGDNDMTPYNIANMAALAGLNIVALTDHNTAKNCPAFFKAARAAGIIPVAGMELTTCEEIHLVCLFEHIEDAMLFDSELDKYRSRIPNNTEIFGEQLIIDEGDEVIGYLPNLLPPATALSLDDAVALVEKFGGVCHPAHIDRESNGIIAMLGTLPETPAFSRVEFNDPNNIEGYKKLYPMIEKMQIISCSDAHYLWDIRDKDAYFELDDEPYSSELVRKRLFERLRG